MIQQTQPQAVIFRELTRIGQARMHPTHPGYAAIVATAHALGLPQCSATDITILDRLQIIERQPRQFAWRADTAAAVCSVCPNHISDRWIISTPRGDSTDMRCRSGGTAATSCRQRISIT